MYIFSVREALILKNRLKQLRTENKFTLDKLAKISGINRGTLNNYELGKTEPKLTTWQSLAEFYEVSVPYLQGIDDTPRREFSSKNLKLEVINTLLEALFSDENANIYLIQVKSQLISWLANTDIYIPPYMKKKDGDKEKQKDFLDNFLNERFMRYFTQQVQISTDYGLIPENRFYKCLLTAMRSEVKYSENEYEYAHESISSIADELRKLDTDLSDREHFIKVNAWTQQDETEFMSKLHSFISYSDTSLKNIYLQILNKTREPGEF